MSNFNIKKYKYYFLIIILSKTGNKKNAFKIIMLKLSFSRDEIVPFIYMLLGVSMLLGVIF